MEISMSVILTLFLVIIYIFCVIMLLAEKAKILKNARLRHIIMAIILIFITPILLLKLDFLDYLKEKGPIGDSIGGFTAPIIGGLNAILVYLAFKEQIKANEQQGNTFVQQQIESRFFELLKIHRDNVMAMKYKEYEVRYIFREIKNDIHFFLTSINDQKETKTVYLKISYLIVYFGYLSNKKYLTSKIEDILLNKNTTKNIFENAFDYQKYLGSIEHEDYENLIDFYGGNGQVAVLGTYFRHLFQTIKYIDEQPSLSYREKYNYIKTLRVQLSEYEQIILFYNSLTFLGEAWELGVDDVNKKLITKYNLIKNILTDLPIEPKKFYPDVSYEKDAKEPTKERLALESFYR